MPSKLKEGNLKTVYKELPKLKQRDLYWIAGLLEGEGYFDSSGRLCIVCTMTDLEPVFKLFSLCGGSFYDHYSKTTRDKQTYRWFLGRRNGSITLAKLLQPLMSPRRQRALQAMIDRDLIQRKNNYELIHGTRSGYMAFKCRCYQCKNAANKYNYDIRKRKKRRE